MDCRVNQNFYYPNFQKKSPNFSSEKNEPENTSKKSKLFKYTMFGLIALSSAFLLKKGYKNKARIKEILSKKLCCKSLNSTKSETNALIRQYAKNNRGKNGIDPGELDKILTDNAKPNGVSERVFSPRPDMPEGRIKTYELADGTKYVLEAHTTQDGDVVTRLYMDQKVALDNFGNYKNERLYLCSDGKFKTNSYLSEESHLKTSEEGKSWLNIE